MVGFMYGQTEYSILENAIHLDDYINHGVNNEFSFLTITDSNMYGHWKFYNKCKSNNIKPVIGLRLSINSTTGKKNCVLLYAKNNAGYRNLLYLSTLQEVNGMVSDEELKAHNNGLFLVTSVIESDLDLLLFNQNFEEADKELNRLQNLVDEFYLGVMPSSFLYGTICNDLLIFVKKHNLKMLPVAKTSYLTEDDEVVYHALLKISESKNVLSIDDLHLKSKNELMIEFKDIPEVFSNLDDVIGRIEDDIIHVDNPLPTYPNKYGIPSGEYLHLLCKKGLEKRLLNTNKKTEVYEERLKYELEVISKMGYDDYFLIVWDFVKFAKNNSIFVGPGRGSAPGSLVAYCLGITEIDPIEYGLLFERFLNPERITMPDIDVDFPDDKRDIVINYVKEKYGVEHVCYISTFGTFQLKSSVRDLFRISAYDTKYIDVVIKLLETNADVSQINKELDNHRELIELIEIAKKIEGLPRHISTHAAGIILSSNSLFESIPLRMGINNIYQSQLEASDLEQLGLLKMDFLGIRNLSLVSDMIGEIKKQNPSFEIKNIPYDDSKTFELLQRGDTLGIFQLEGSGITNFIKKLKPTSFEDLVAILALYRPGPMDNINTYIERKHGQSFEYVHPLLEDILKDTYGIIIYQEQIMKIAREFSGYSLGEADVLRRAVSKKKKDVLERERVSFVEHANKKGYSLDIANEIYDYIAKFADYGFNRSHTVAYAIFAYQMAYLKANYFHVFMSKILNNVIGNDKELANYINYSINRKIKIYPVDVNESINEFTIYKDGLIMPINSIKGIGNIVTSKIISERKNGSFKDFFDFKNRLSDCVNAKMLDSLINVGFFDSFGKTHSFYKQNLESTFDVYIDEEEAIYNVDEFSYDELRDHELESLGFNLKYNIFHNYEKYKEAYKATDPKDLVLGKKVNVIGQIKYIKVIDDKQKRKMAFVSLNCNNELLDVVCFPEKYVDYQDVLSSKKIILINGFVRERNDTLQVQLERAKELD